MDGADACVPEPLRDIIYRVVQESVANALRHADTRDVSVAVEHSARDISVRVANRGPARDKVEKVPGLGLTSMDERVEAAGGQLRIDRDADGWTVAARFPPVQAKAIAS